MNSTIIFLSIFLIIMSIMLEININFNYSMATNKISINFFVYKIKIISIKVDILSLYYEINNNKKQKKLKLVFPKEDRLFLSEIKKNLINKLYLHKVVSSIELGVMNAKDVAMIISTLNIVGEDLKKRLDSRDIDYVYINSPIFSYHNINLSLKITVFFTIFDMIFALILSFYKRSRYVRQNKKSKQPS